jgi:hypothetical protein
MLCNLPNCNCVQFVLEKIVWIVPVFFSPHKSYNCPRGPCRGKTSKNNKSRCLELIVFTISTQHVSTQNMFLSYSVYSIVPSLICFSGTLNFVFRRYLLMFPNENREIIPEYKQFIVHRILVISFTYKTMYDIQHDGQHNYTKTDEENIRFSKYNNIWTKMKTFSLI